MPCWASPPRPSFAAQLASRDAGITALQASKADAALLASYATNAALSASETALQSALDAILAELAALQLSGSGVVNTPAWAGFTTWELLRGSSVVRNLHFVAPLSAALANGDDTLSITADCYSTAGTDAAIAAALLAYYTSSQVDTLLGDCRTERRRTRRRPAPSRPRCWPTTAGRRSVYRQVRYLSVRRQSEGQLSCCDVRAVSHLSVVQDLRDVARDRSFKHVFLGVAVTKWYRWVVALSPSQVLRGVPAVRRSFLCDSGVGVFDTHLFGTSFRKYVSQSVGDLESEARTRPAPGPHQARTRPAPGPHQARTRPAPGPRQGFFFGCDSI